MKTCTWIGNGEGCSHPTVGDRSYCEHHIWRVYQKGTHLSKRKKDIKTARTVHFWESLMDEAVAELEAEGWDFSIKEWDAEDLTA
jgi:hypothetical protein